MPFNPAELHMAIIYKNFDAVTRIVESGSKLDTLWRGTSAVSCALYIKAYKILEYLVKNGANVNIRTQDYKMEPPLFAACRLGRLEVVKILLRAPSLDIDQRDFFNRTPLWAAARFGSYEMVDLLLQYGADVRAAQDSIECPLLLSIMMLLRNPNLQIPYLLIKRGCALDYTSSAGSPLYFSVKYKNLKLFNLLIRAGCKVKNVKWLSADKLPDSWKEDDVFCRSVSALHNNPHSLFHLTLWTIRDVFIKVHKNIQPHHIEQLPIPTVFQKLLSLED